MNAEALSSCSSLDTVIKFVCDCLNYVVQAELTKQIISFFIHIIEAVPKRLSEQSQKAVIKHYDKVIQSLMAAVANERGSSIFDQISMCFLGIMQQTEALGLLNLSEQAIMSSFNAEFNQKLGQIDPKTREVFVFVVTTLRSNKFHIRMALVNLNWII